VAACDYGNFVLQQTETRSGCKLKVVLIIRVGGSANSSLSVVSCCYFNEELPVRRAYRTLYLYYFIIDIIILL
jgi:hypothetical protein